MAVVCKSQPSDAENIAGIARPLRVGGAQWRNNILLAPMSGVSDVPFRRAAWRCGAGMVFSEMVASEALVTGHMEMQMKAESAGLPFHVVQLAGRQVILVDDVLTTGSTVSAISRVLGKAGMGETGVLTFARVVIGDENDIY